MCVGSLSEQQLPRPWKTRGKLDLVRTVIGQRRLCDKQGPTMLHARVCLKAWQRLRTAAGPLTKPLSPPSQPRLNPSTHTLSYTGSRLTLALPWALLRQWVCRTWYQKADCIAVSARALPAPNIGAAVARRHSRPALNDQEIPFVAASRPRN